MTLFKALSLTTLMMLGIGLWGLGVYTADASANQAVVDGYGVIASTR